MKKLLIALVVVTLTSVCYGQGQVVFANKVGTVVDAPVFIAGTQVGPGPDYSAQLFLVSGGGSLTPLTPATTFRASGTGAAAIADRYWINQDVIVPGVASGATATFVVRAWRTREGSYDTAFGNKGQSAPFDVVLGGGQLPPANLTTLQGFVVGLPEPGTIALGVLGAVALVLCRRRPRVG